MAPDPVTALVHKGRDLLGLLWKMKLQEPVACAGHQIFPWGGPEHDNPALEGGVKAAGLREAVAHQGGHFAVLRSSGCALFYIWTRLSFKFKGPNP